MPRITLDPGLGEFLSFREQYDGLVADLERWAAATVTRTDRSLLRAVLPVGMIVSVQRFKVRIEGHGWEDFEEIELPRPPSEGDTLETKLGTTVVTGVDPMPNSHQFAGTIRCRLP